MVAAVCGWHERHPPVVRAIEQRLARGDTLVVAVHALVETYAVLTRLPAPHRLSPADAWALVKANFVEGARLAALDGGGHVAMLDDLARDGRGGGRTYDALIAASIAAARVPVVLTLNPRHFDPAPTGVRVIEPAAD